MSDRKVNGKTLPERVVRLETEMVNLCDDINKIMTNHLPHLESKIDRLTDKVHENTLQNRDNTVKLAFVIPLIMGVIQLAIKVVFK